MYNDIVYFAPFCITTSWFVDCLKRVGGLRFITIVRFCVLVGGDCDGRGRGRFDVVRHVSSTLYLTSSSLKQNKIELRYSTACRILHRTLFFI